MPNTDERVKELKEIALELLERCNRDGELRKFPEHEYRAIEKRILGIQEGQISFRDITTNPDKYKITTQLGVIYAYDVITQNAYKVGDMTAEALTNDIIKVLGLHFSPEDQSILKHFK